jgi:arabinogalactan endo-1,4-beta-galactosidase
MKPFKSFWAILLLCLMSLSGLDADETLCSATSLVDDAFPGTVLDRCKWDEVSQNSGPFTVNEEAVATTDPAFAYSIPRMTGQYRLTGDFDIQIDYRLGDGYGGTLPPNGGLEQQMAVYWDDSRYIQIGRGKDAGGEYIKPYTPIKDQGGINGIRVPNAQLNGRLRITRTGVNITLLYWSGAAWQTLAAAQGPNEPAYVYLGSIAANAGRAFTCYFDNFLLNSGPTSYHPFVRNNTFRRRPDFYVGGVVCDYMGFQNWGNTWNGVNPLDPLKANGMKWVRVGVTTVSSSFLANTPPEQWPTLPWRDEYWSSREFAGQIMREAQDRGYRLNLFLFLSNTAAHAGQQNAPPEWAGLTVAETAQRVDQYSFEIANYYTQRGLNIEIYDIGNEIDFGILNFRPGDRVPIPPGVDITNNMTFMRENVWNIEAQLLQASINGIKRANPNAKIVLHAAGVNVSRSNVFVKDFFRTMVATGVEFDYAGLSNPYNQPGWVVPAYSTDCWFQRLQEVIDYCETLDKPVIFSEASYPHNPTGTVGTAMPEFSYTPEGQATWTREHLRFLSNQPNVRGFFWFYPDYHMQLNRDPALMGSSLFQSPTQPMPSLAEFRVNLGTSAFDFDGDGRADLSVFRPTAGEWYYQESGTNVTRGFRFGSASDRVATADFTGDAKTDIAFWRPSTGEWYVLRSEDLSFYAFPFGASGDIPAPADYDGDGRADAAVFRPSAATWFILRSSDGGVTSTQFGLASDQPVPADYDGDGKADVGIYRPDLGQWWNLRSSDGSVFAATFGSSTDRPTPGDFTGDGKADVAFFRPSTGEWYVLRSEDQSFYAFPFGASGDKPAPGDYDGDGRFDAAIFRPSDTNWYLLRSTGGLYIQQFGAANDIPLPGAFVP